MNCVNCHATPWGGGPRTVYGKIFGSHGHKASPFSKNDLYYGDARFLAFYPTHSTQSQSGVTQMQASASANVPVIQGESGSEVRGVFTFNMAQLGGAYPRDAFIRWQLPTDSGANPFQLVFGRFYVPFGLLTDEHRTYTRIQTNMTYNNYDVGGAVAGNLGNDLHFDLAVVNDFTTGGGFSNHDLTAGVVLNIRWNPSSLPFLIGASGTNSRTLLQPQPYASSLYGVLSLDRLTGFRASGSLSAERVDAQNWNNPLFNTGLVTPGLSAFFIPTTDTNYLAQVTYTASRGYYLLAKYNLNTTWTLLYKFDYLLLDTAHPEDAFTRHGFGFESYFNSNMILGARYEFANIGRVGVPSGSILAGINDFILTLRLWI